MRIAGGKPPGIGEEHSQHKPNRYYWFRLLKLDLIAIQGRSCGNKHTEPAQREAYVCVLVNLFEQFGS